MLFPGLKDTWGTRVTEEENKKRHRESSAVLVCVSLSAAVRRGFGCEGEEEGTLGRQEATELDQPQHLQGPAQNGNAEPLVQKGWKIQDSHSRALSQGTHLSEGLCASLGLRWCGHGEAGPAEGRVCG